MIDIKHERMDERVTDEMDLLAPEHYDEVFNLKDFGLKPDWPRYHHLENSGVLALFTMRDDGKLIGYLTYIISPHLHHSDVLYAGTDLLFIKKEYRGKGNARRFIEFSELTLSAMGVHAVTQSVKVTCDYSPLLLKMDYEPHETVYIKRI